MPDHVTLMNKIGCNFRTIHKMLITSSVAPIALDAATAIAALLPEPT